jgi:hypothetical protein
MKNDIPKRILAGDLLNLIEKTYSGTHNRIMVKITQLSGLR